MLQRWRHSAWNSSFDRYWAPQSILKIYLEQNCKWNQSNLIISDRNQMNFNHYNELSSTFWRKTRIFKWFGISNQTTSAKLCEIYNWFQPKKAIVTNWEKRKIWRNCIPIDKNLGKCLCEMPLCKLCGKENCKRNCGRKNFVCPEEL